MKKAFIVVGHANWGKSETLARLTNENRKARHMRLPSIDSRLTAYVRRISNDDNEESLKKFATDMALRLSQDYLIMTLCPDFSAGRQTRAILDSLITKYELHFFVLKNNYSNPEYKISREEINILSEYGITFVLSDSLESKDRASCLVDFVKKHLSRE